MSDRWFTDVSGLGLAEQARMLTHPAPPKREEELAELVDMWQDKMRRLEAHGDEFKMPQCPEDVDDRQGQRVLRPVGGGP